jgi:ubiquitin conjugation factor E4 B
MFGGSTPSPNSLADFEVPRLLQDIVQRFEPEDGLAEILGPVVTKLLFHPCLFREEGLAASDPRWRGVLTGLEALVAQKQIATMIIKSDEWIPADATAATFETKSLMGPLLRLNVFSREWVRELSNSDRCKTKTEARYKPYITKMYFSNSETRPAVDIESSQGSLRGTLKSLQVMHSWHRGRSGVYFL